MKLLVVFLRRQLEGKPTGCIPAGGELALRWFLDLCRTRSSNGYGPNPISHGEIDAYARLYRWPIAPRHVDMILALDRAWLDHAAGRVHGSTARTAGQEMTPQAFDAVFG